MSKKGDWNYVDGDASRLSVYLPKKTLNQINQYKEKKKIRSRNMAVNDIIAQGLENNDYGSAIEISLPRIHPRYLFEDSYPKPPLFVNTSAFCTTVMGIDYTNGYSGNNSTSTVQPVPVLYLQNIGRTSAKEIHLEIYDTRGKKLDSIDRYAFAVGEYHRTMVNLAVTNTVRIKGSYEDMTGKKHDTDRTFHYPPK